MKIALGGTRIVFIFSKIVVKIPLIHVLYPFKYLFMRKDKRATVSNRLKMNAVRKVLSYVFCGFIANRIEYLYSKSHRDYEGILHVRGLLFGIIIIQARGEVPKENDGRWMRLLHALKMLGIKEKDTLRACNFCIWKNRIRMSDYGFIDTIDGLEKKNLKIIERFGF